jgi:hypothetical protein
MSGLSVFGNSSSWKFAHHVAVHIVMGSVFHNSSSWKFAHHVTVHIVMGFS